MSIPLSVESLSLAGKVAIVTGGGTGIGRGIALAFARAGADVAVTGRRTGPLDATAKEIEGIGRRALAISTDVSVKNDVDNMIERTNAELGDIDILVNNAANGGSGPSMLDSNEARWDQIIDTNLKSVYLCCHAVGQGMIARGRGNIINISSIAGIDPGGCRIYGVAKAAVNFLTRGLSIDMAPHGVRVNCIAPGAVRTDMLTHDVGTEEENWDQLATYIPLQRVGQPIDMASVALFLASDAANYITGQTIAVDAGLTAGNFTPTIDFTKEMD
jgi:NAD(P)-dependent dehydrogenase (short-subunit alcohol dehydrogenase family)